MRALLHTSYRPQTSYISMLCWIAKGNNCGTMKALLHMTHAPQDGQHLQIAVSEISYPQERYVIDVGQNPELLC